MYAAQWMLLERYISIKPAISRSGDIFSDSETTDLLGALSTTMEMDFLMHFGALLNGSMLLRFVKCGGRLICGRIWKVFRKVSWSVWERVKFF
ncbi:hypothetical protein CEXT_353751 [Caerostris extrusa]|uniref:Uncharacterized protein n=1 Tax=Caerostris extrusa TaxID=172846 RepID=A0AAV4QV89_CAEEX|nr:hypothetical protein CEXT_353751 [Caerostris extrusa]